MFWYFPTSEEIGNKKLHTTTWSYFENWDPYRNYLVAKEKCGLNEVNESNIGTFTNFAQTDQYLYPFNPIALTLFDPDLLSQNINIVKSGESYVVSLKIKIQNHNGTKKDDII